jgi:surfeit locus 1 family protein
MMRLPPALGVGLAALAALVCVRLGFWQLSRLEEKRALNRALVQAETEPPAPFDAARLEALPADSLRLRRYAVHGTFDPRRHVLLIARSRGGEPGVDVVTPLAIASDGPMLLVDRGFLPSADGATARAQDLPEPDSTAARMVTGFVERLRPRDRRGFLRNVERDTLEVWQTPWLDRDSIATALGIHVLPFVLHELPDPGVPASPARAKPAKFDEALHLNYAVQWFSFAAIIAVGSIVLLVRSRRPRNVEDSP